ncbi:MULTISPECIES: anthranilate synthase component II [Acinetobacter]|uniref:Anthranilate/para-aminobenzoate synthase component II n=2 Tax=Acinetobacter nosocomialis TaxID=106654 RepID=A0AA36KC04_ACINO|nr:MULTISPECIES: aminodeoxychorismate/anthranilate synthase component II [Acinetobacter]KCX93108.1 anthranilate synthase component II [Acinetobacter baumannii 6112]MDQ9824452.1 aminodeoxychorismate/anthranilate synthase component II [Acinetobacter sp. 163]AZC02165.1 aminodeoxychorismate/anthranilate synthase component II [Acinetobacter nosocomialis]AZC07170.1 aminodeoxychorismate/anthranilate synthase component II [Acinetobacter nosocomialis]AZC07640.1 aminodeoxychorismate/anthranilate synthas
MLLMIDNYDSFTYNIVQYFGELNQEVKVVRNDQVTLEDIERWQPKYLVIGPGPCSPSEAGISIPAINHFAGKIPLLGVCLGHQSIGQAFGGKIVRAKTVMHGRLSDMYHSNKGIFINLPSPFSATRYHSLVIDQETLPDCLEVTCWTNEADGSMEEIMGVKHKTLPVEGVQFHPESILSQHGHQIFKNFLDIYA